MKKTLEVLLLLINCISRYKSSAMLYHVTWYQVTNVSGEHNPSTFRGSPLRWKHYTPLKRNYLAVDIAFSSTYLLRVSNLVFMCIT